MNLSADQLMELIIAVSDGANRLADHEKRQAPRISMKFPILWRPLLGTTGQTGEAQRAWLKDLSSGGVGILVSEPMEEGTSFIVELPKLGDHTLEVLCLCCYCQLQPDGNYQVGGQYLAEWSNPFSDSPVEDEALEV